MWWLVNWTRDIAMEEFLKSAWQPVVDKPLSSQEIVAKSRAPRGARRGTFSFVPLHLKVPHDVRVGAAEGAEVLQKVHFMGNCAFKFARFNGAVETKGEVIPTLEPESEPDFQPSQTPIPTPTHFIWNHWNRFHGRNQQIWQNLLSTSELNRLVTLVDQKMTGSLVVQL